MMRAALIVALVLGLTACATKPTGDGLKAATEFCGTGKPDCFIP